MGKTRRKRPTLTTRSATIQTTGDIKGLQAVELVEEGSHEYAEFQRVAEGLNITVDELVQFVNRYATKHIAIISRDASE